MPTAAKTLVPWLWNDLVLFEPELSEVERFALDLHPSHPDREDWRMILGMLRPLAGQAARRPELRARKPFDVASEHLRRCWETGTKDTE